MVVESMFIVGLVMVVPPRLCMRGYCTKNHWLTPWS